MNREINRGKHGNMGVSGHICLYVACYDFALGFNVSSLVLMIFQVGFWGLFHANFLFIIWFKMRGIIVEVDRFSPASLKPVAGRFLGLQPHLHLFCPGAQKGLCGLSLANHCHVAVQLCKLKREPCFYMEVRQQFLFRKCPQLWRLCATGWWQDCAEAGQTLAWRPWR